MLEFRVRLQGFLKTLITNPNSFEKHTLDAKWHSVVLGRDYMVKVLLEALFGELRNLPISEKEHLDLIRVQGMMGKHAFETAALQNDAHE